MSNISPSGHPPGAHRADQLLAQLPPPWPDDPRPALQAAVRANGAKVVVLDDDPTGTQTVHGVPVLTEWSVETLRVELLDELPAVYLLTNTRSLPLPEAQALNATIGHNLGQAAQLAGRRFEVISRSDSTLRGHFPGEAQALADALHTALGDEFDAWLLIPFFGDGGRYTIDDVQYVAEGDWLIPAAQTPFAQDAVFGYGSSNLRAWVEEKTAGRVAANSVASISLQDIRRGGPERVRELLAALPRGSICVVNVADERDLAVFTTGLLQAEARGQRFLARTAATYVALRAGLSRRPLLTAADLDLPASGGGLIVAGSYVPKTSAQLAALKELPNIHSIEIPVDALLSETEYAATIRQAKEAVDAAIGRGDDTLLYTSRQLVTGADAAASLDIGRRVSQGLVDIVRAMTTRPRYLLAKGGITSSDLATQALGVRRAMVLGQILPGVPVWKLGPESRHPDLPYIVFPGNVGGPGALAEVMADLSSDP